MSNKKPEPRFHPLGTTLVIEPPPPPAARATTLVMEPAPPAEDDKPPETQVISTRAGTVQVQAPFPITEPGHGDDTATRQGTPWAGGTRHVAPAHPLSATVDLFTPPELPPREPVKPSPEDLLPPSDPWGAGLRRIEPPASPPEVPRPVAPAPPNRRVEMAKSLYAKLGRKR